MMNEGTMPVSQYRPWAVR